MNLLKFFRQKKPSKPPKKRRAKKDRKAKDEGLPAPSDPKPELSPKMVCVCYHEDEVKQGLPENEYFSECEETEMSDVDWEKDTATDRKDDEVAQLIKCQEQYPPVIMTKYMNSHSKQMVQEFAEAISQQKLIDDINCYVDELIGVFHRFVDENKYDPFTIDDFENNDVEKVTVYGARSLRRTADAHLFKEDCGTLAADLRGGFQRIRIVAEVRRRVFPGMIVRGTVRALFEETEFRLKLWFSANNWMKPTLQKFEIYDWGKVKVSFRGRNWLGSMVHCTTRNVLPNVLTETAKRRLPPFLKERLEQWLQKATE